MPNAIPEVVDGLPNISGHEDDVAAVTSRREPVYLGRTPLRLDSMQSAFAIALHMHQPLIPGDGDLATSRIVSNLQVMMENQHIHGNHDAPVFAHCYSRIADLVRELVNAGRHPRVMLDYSGELLWGLRQMGRGDILDNLKSVTLDDRYWPCVEWLGTMWGHCVAPSTPPPDYRLHIRAWQQHFAGIFGWDALARVHGFSPPEMHLPNHPDVAYEYVKTLRDCGYRWLLVQEHTVEETDGHGLRERYLPRRLLARNSEGEELSITAIIKTQGSDTKLIGHMQPVSEARGLHPREVAGRRVPPLVAQISDGENGGVMMNEFPGHFQQTWHQIGTEGTVGANVTEYLELLAAVGIRESDFEPVLPLHQHQLWAEVGTSISPERITKAIEELKKRDHRFHVEGGSWTNNLSWVRGYEDVLDPMNKLSAAFQQKLAAGKVDRGSQAYRNALYHLLTSETSCYRYWGQGRWTDYAREICRRGQAILAHDFR
jgi:hypothetical protein